MRTILVTGGAGFIGSNFIYEWLKQENFGTVINLDQLGLSGNLKNLAEIKEVERHIFIKGEIQNRALVQQLLDKYAPEAIINFAAETHVDRSIVAPEAFIQTNVVGTYHLLEEALAYWKGLVETKKTAFRFLQISTDEVYGTLAPGAPSSTEGSSYAPNSPYSASKAAADHLVRSYFHTYGLPTLTTHGSNSYGPYQFPEKLVPLMITNALQGQLLPLYGDGMNVRNWLHVSDHCAALKLVLKKGIPGEIYNIGSDVELTNQELINLLCDELDRLLPNSSHKPHRGLIHYVKDRPGHDRRYSLNSSKIRNEMGWRPQVSLQSGLYHTISWYISHKNWLDDVQSGAYCDWIKSNYLERGSV